MSCAALAGGNFSRAPRRRSSISAGPRKLLRPANPPSPRHPSISPRPLHHPSSSLSSQLVLASLQFHAIPSRCSPPTPIAPTASPPLILLAVPRPNSSYLYWMLSPPPRKRAP
uniref:Uncharacterized protein n=1 Tax=Coccidioides posadasii RMSCC 3488 TaxID=454284 RepID=A0A0J6FK03_COCPO|nr:hypothetical protein CPAG_06049 [Coccidioides posadasii RMSCC 3488]